MGLDVCESGHSEIVYQGGGMFSGYNKCPLCEAIEEKEELQKEVDSLQEKIDELESAAAEH